jgi:stage V sporulation protein B
MKEKRWFSSGATILIAGGFVCKCLGAFFRLPLTNLLGIEGIGIFQLVMSLYSFSLVTVCGGVTTTLSKLISSTRARGEYSKISTYFSRAVSTVLFFGFAVGVLFCALGKFVAALQGANCYGCYFLFVLLLPLGGLIAVYRGYFQGHANMFPTAISQVLEQVAKFCFGLLFASIFSRVGINEGVFGAFLGIVVSELVSLVALVAFFGFRKEKLQRMQDLTAVKLVQKEFDKTNALLTLTNVILPLVNAFDALVIVPRLLSAGFSSAVATKLYGLQSGVVGAFLNFPLIISISVTTVLLPNLSYLISRGAKSRYLIERGIKLLLLLLLPTTFGLVAISKQVLPLVYPDLSGQMLSVTLSLMSCGAFGVVFTALMQYFVMLLQANGDFRFVAIVTSIGGAAKGLVTVIFAGVSSINIFALVLGNILMSAFVCLACLCKLKRTFAFRLRPLELALLVSGCAVMSVGVVTFINKNYFGAIVNILLGVLLGVVIYAVFALPVLYFSLKKKNNMV